MDNSFWNTAPPSAPTITWEYINPEKATVTWTSVPTATSYSVSINGHTPISLPVDACSYSFTKQANITAYTASVVAINRAGSSSPARIEIHLAHPRAPTITWKCIHPEEATVTWTSVPTATSYRVSINGHTPISLPADACTYSFTRQANITDYTFSVVAINSAGSSSPARIQIHLVPREVEEYKTFLRATYDRLQQTDDSWPPVRFQEYIKLATVVKVEDFMHEDDCTKAMMMGDLQIVKRLKQSIEIEQVGRCKDGKLASCIIVEGIPGVGKSTLAWELGRRWGKGEILQDFHLVIVLRLRDERVQSADVMSKLFYHPDPDIQQSVGKWVSTTLGEKVLMILDGYDELPSELQIGDRSVLAGIIKGKELPKLTVLVTSRPSANRNLYQLCRGQNKCQYIEVVGFGEKEIQEYVERSLKHNSGLMEGFQSYLEHHPHIHSLMYVPINCAIVVELFREHKGKPPQTLTEVYIALTSTLLKRHEEKFKQKTSNSTVELLKKHYRDLVGSIQDPAGLAGSLYSRGVISQHVRDEIQERDLTTQRKNEVLINAVEAQVTTDPSVYQMFMEVLGGEPYLSTIVRKMAGTCMAATKVACFGGLSPATVSQLIPIARLAYQGTLKEQLIFHGVSETIESLGLLKKVPQLYLGSSSTASYNFIHKTLQEFLTAWHVSSLPSLEQRAFVRDALTKPNMAMTVRFMAGLTKFQTSPEDVGGFADIVISLKTYDKKRLIENLHWMFETQNPAFIQRLMGTMDQTFDCSDTHINPFDLYVLGYCIANSSTLWAVNFAECSMSDECMRMMLLAEDGKAFHHIISLKLGENSVSNSGASLLGMMLKENNTLKKLNFEKCRLQPEALEGVFKGVQVNTMLETLDLSYNTIDAKSASCLATALKHNTTLSELSLGKCGLVDEAICELCGGLKWCRLKTLHLWCNPFREQGAKSLADVIKDNTATLEELVMYACDKISNGGVHYLMDAMRSNTTLKMLTLPYQYKHLVPPALVSRVNNIV